jgi:decaprenylphospho-beta-D-ribofuranose 2-oxidase
LRVDRVASLKFNEMALTGWGGLEPHESRVYRPAKGRELRDTLALDAAGGMIARGMGRSYGDSATLEKGAVVLGGRLNRMLAFDAERGVLTCEAGVSFADVLATFVPRGYFLPVTPGTKFVTVGGAIAADIHGKNHHLVGSFGNFVESFELWTGTGELIHCSRDENADVFWATIGGMGLTGYIVTASFRLLAIESSWMRVNTRQVPNLTELLKLVTAGGNAPTYSVAWIDCLARDEEMGRAVLIEAEHARRADLIGSNGDAPLAVPRARKLGVPFNFPGFVLNPWSVSLFNKLYYKVHPTKSDVFTSYEPFFYPLDGINDWNRIYGKRGFIQYQALLPLETSSVGIPKVLSEIVQSRLASFLAVLKRTGDANEGMLSYCKPGITLALDLPNVGAPLRELAARLDKLLLDYGGRLYFAKDSLTKPEVIAQMYPRLDEFRAVKSRIDPQNKFVSAQAKRLGIVR